MPNLFKRSAKNFDAPFLLCDDGANKAAKKKKNPMKKAWFTATNIVININAVSFVDLSVKYQPPGAP